MDPVIVNERIQEFRGKRYYRCGSYFRANGKLLHRDVWAFNNDWRGVPDGFDVHHKDRDTSNNSNANLEAMETSLHAAMHHKGHRRVPVAAIAAAPAWHASEDGREWHKQHHQEHGAAMYRDGDFRCDWCGIEFRTRITMHNRFCSPNCKTKSRKASGVDNEERACVVCGERFVANRYSTKKTCSLRCASTLSGSVRRGQG